MCLLAYIRPHIEWCNLRAEYTELSMWSGKSIECNMQRDFCTIITSLSKMPLKSCQHHMMCLIQLKGWHWQCHIAFSVCQVCSKQWAQPITFTMVRYWHRWRPNILTIFIERHRIESYNSRKFHVLKSPTGTLSEWFACCERLIFWSTCICIYILYLLPEPIYS